jgi:hypothetical protein
MLVAVMVASCSGSSSPGDPRLDSLIAAEALHPDALTKQNMRTLVAVLNAEDWGYLTYAQWPDDGGVAALTDPTLRKAVAALAASPGGGLTLNTTSALSVAAEPTRAALGAGTFPMDDWEALFEKAIPLFKGRWGLDYAGTPAAATAFADLLNGLIASAPGSPLPDPKVSADGILDGCGNYLYVNLPHCSPIAFCCKGDIDFKTGRTLCNDFTSCRPGTPPMLGTVNDTTSDGTTSPPPSSAPGDMSNPCFVGDAVAQDPTNWIAACEALDAQTPSPIGCLDAQPNLHLGPPTLMNGADPTKVCKVFTNEDGIGTPLGEPTGCDHEGGSPLTCYCCPAQ